MDHLPTFTTKSNQMQVNICHTWIPRVRDQAVEHFWESSSSCAKVHGLQVEVRDEQDSLEDFLPLGG